MENTLFRFVNDGLREASLALLDQFEMKYTLGAAKPVSIRDLCKNISLSKAADSALNAVTSTYFVAQIDQRTFDNNPVAVAMDTALAEAKQEKYNGMFVFAVDIDADANITRTLAATLTRVFNRLASNKPVVLFIRQKDMLSISTCERSDYAQQWRSGEKMGKVSILRDINCKKPHRGHVDVLNSIREKVYSDFDGMYKHWKEVFSSELLTKKFYTELSEWYAWAIQVMRFPNVLDDDTDDTKYNSESGIRLVTRLIFVWFLKHKGLIPDEFFDEDALKRMLKGFEPTQKEHSLFGYMSKETKYYTAILQNLFFAMLNSPLTDGKDFSRGFRKYDAEGNATSANRGDHHMLRYKNLFTDPDEFLRLANMVPFLNGGLFECLDEVDNKFYLDGFSENEKVVKSLCVPDYLFFGEQNDIDLSEWYDDNQKRRMKVRGIIDILKSYQFTIEENTPYEQEVSLDPELLGKVFENLLASYNPETNKTARKSTGSYYTPREIVQYMVDESLVAYLKEKVGGDMEEQYRQLLDYSETEIELQQEQKQQIMSALYQCKALDPACGSGAFPMGMLQQMVHVLTQLDPDNIIWKQLIEEKSKQELADSLNNYTKEERDEVQADINRSFDLSQNAPAYARKLYLIENCIYGVDIQTTAIQISKLRCFISLVVDQKVNKDPVDNYGIRPLPNLEARFVAANTLIGVGSDLSLANTEKVVAIKSKLKNANHRIFNAKTMRTKRKWKDNIIAYREELCESLEETGFITHDEASLVSSWDMFNQNVSSTFFDTDWMFGVQGGFDIVIGNPPYIDSETMTAVMPEMRIKYSKLYRCAKGNWDMFIVFLEKGIDLCTKSGIYSFIVPNKLIGADYSVSIKEKIKTGTIIEIRDYSRVKVFLEVNVYPCTIVGSKKTQSDKILFTTMREKNEISSIKNIDIDTFSRCSFWDVYFRDDIIVNLIIKYLKHRPIAHNNNEINTSATVSEAYDLKPVILDSNIIHDCLKIINTGTIDPYLSLWGIRPMQYIKGRYLYPIITEKSLGLISNNRLKQAKSNKVIIAGMSGRIEALYDEGTTLAGKSTIIITNKKDDKDTLFSILGLLNSKLTSYCLFVMYHSLKMSGGFLNVNKSVLSSATMPTNAANSELLIKLTKTITDEKLKDPQADTTVSERKIDILVYLLYGLTYDEVMVVENASQGEKLKLDKATYDKWLGRYQKGSILPSEEEMKEEAK